MTKLFLELIGLLDFLKGNKFELTLSVKRVINVTLGSVARNEPQDHLIFFIVVEFQTSLFDDWFEILNVDVIGLLQAHNSLRPLNLVKSMLHRTLRKLVFLDN